MLVIVNANNQGVHEYLSLGRLACLQEGLLTLHNVRPKDLGKCEAWQTFLARVGTHVSPS